LSFVFDPLDFVLVGLLGVAAGLVLGVFAPLDGLALFGAGRFASFGAGRLESLTGA
jgi:hypothetical protein